MSKPNEIGRDIRIIRIARGYTQEWAALESDLSVTWWRNIENHEKCLDMSMDTLNCVAKTLGVPPWILGILALPDEDLATMIRKIPQMEQGKKEAR